MTPKQSEVRPSVPKWKEVMMCLREEVHMVDKLPSGRSQDAADRELNINESIYVK